MKSTTHHPKSVSRQNLLWLAFAIACATFLLFSPAIDFDYVDYDDGVYVYANTEVLKGLSSTSLKYAFTSTAGGSWMPLTWLSHMLDVSMSGRTPAGQHTTNILVHSISAALLFLFLHRTTHRLWPAAFVAAIFAFHPLRNESVVWVSERKDVLSTCLLMLGLLAYAHHVEKPSRKSMALVAVCLVLGLMSKPMLVTFPFMLLLLDFWPLNRLGNTWPDFKKSLWPCVREKLPLFAIVAIVCFVTYWTQARAGAVNQEQITISTRSSNVLGNIFFYLKIFFWPEPLNAIRPAIETSLPQAAGIAALLIAITAFACWRAFRQPWMLVGWLWFIGTLVPVVGIVRIGHISVSERYSYIPTIGLIIFATQLGVWLIESRPRLRPAMVVVAVAIATACVWATRRDLPRWKDSIALFDAAIRANPHPVSYNNIGVCYLDRRQYDLAIAPLSRAIEMDPRYVKAYINRVTAYQKTGRTEEARADLAELVKIEPRNAEGYNSRGDVLLDLGRYDEAIKDFTSAITLSPKDAHSYNNRATAHLMKGDYKSAALDCEKAIQLSPRYANAHNNLGNVYNRSGDHTRALDAYTRAIQLSPGDSLTYNNRAAVYYALKRYNDAIADLRTCQQLGGNPHPGLIQAIQQATQITPTP